MALAALACATFVACKHDATPASPAPANAPVHEAPAPVAPVPAPEPAEAIPPPRPAPLVERVTIGALHACALLRDHTIRCWGANPTGQLGDGTTTDRRLPLVTELENASFVSAGAGHTCAIVAGGVKCWGDNHAGQLGDGTTGEHDLPHDVEGVHDAVEVAAGAAHTCVRTSVGSVECWGENAHGELGDGTHTAQTHPVAVRGVAHAEQIVAGDGFSCARLSGGTVRCWGAALRTLGAAGRTPMGNAVRGATSLAANGSSLCAALAGGTVRCWDVFANTPVSPPSTSGLHGIEVATSGGIVPRVVNGLPAPAESRSFVCARSREGTVSCGGDGDRGQLGQGAAQSAPSASVQGLRDVVQIAAGGESLAAGGHACGVACALDRAGSLRCWGCNEHGVVGDGTVTDRAAPVAMSW